MPHGPHPYLFYPLQCPDELHEVPERHSLHQLAGDDVFLVGQTVIVKGSVADMAAGAGETIRIDGSVGGDLMMAGRQIRISENAGVGLLAFLEFLSSSYC